MKYFEWWGELDSIEVRFSDRQFNGFWFVEGSPVVGWAEFIIAVYLCDDIPRFDFGIARNGWPIFSERMRDFLNGQCPGLVQFLPFRLQRPDGSAQTGRYSVGQVLRLVDCLDKERTKIRESWAPINEFGDFAVLRPLVLSSKIIGDHQLFRIKGHSGSVVIREDLKDAIEAAGFGLQRFDDIEVQ